jgi:hypothetical protein
MEVMKAANVSPLQKLVEIGTQLGSEHARDHERFRLHWEEHVENSRRMILQGAGRVSEPESVTILGGGASYNIPVEELAERFNLVRLVDIDRDGLEQAVANLPLQWRSKIEVRVADSTAGVATRLLGRGLEIIHDAGNPEEALNQLLPLFQGQGLDMRSDAGQVDDWKASYVVSSGLSSQLNIFPEKGVSKAFQEKFETELEEDFFFKQGSFRLRNEWVRCHGEFLASLVSPNGRVYWADTVAETPYLSEFGSAPLAAIVQAVAGFLERAYLKTFLTETGKDALAERFAEGLPGHRMSGDELIQAFPKLIPERKRRFAWAMITLVGENRIAPKRELELVSHIIREAERMNSQARRPLIEGGKLSAFFPASLEPEGEMVSWLWINDPEGAVTLDGYSYYVEAYILKGI